MAKKGFKIVTGEDDLDDDRPQPKKEVPPAYRIYSGSRIAISKAVGKLWDMRKEAAIKAYEEVLKVWDTCFAYYNAYHGKELDTPAGIFRRGDGTENVVYSNVNVLLPAVYSKNPEITCSTIDEEDEAFCKSHQALLNRLLKDRRGINAKPKLRRAIGLGLLTNLGVVKLDFTQKDESREAAVEEVAKLTDELAKAKNTKTVAELLGKLGALEEQIEVREPRGPRMTVVMPQDLIVDPLAVNQDGTDGSWMMERVFIPTAVLNARFKEERKNEDGEPEQRLVYKPSHQLGKTVGDTDDLRAIYTKLGVDNTLPTSYTDEGRLAYIAEYVTECYYVWDKASRRVLLFDNSDWTWPLWVWDDPLNLSRFFPYFVISFGLSIGGTVTVGDIAYSLDQQDEINEINRHFAAIRRTIYHNFFYNSDKMNAAEAAKLANALRGDPKTRGVTEVFGVAAGDLPIKDVFEAVVPPSLDYSILFGKGELFATISRTGGVNEALRGAQFKTNTNTASVESYQDALRLNIGAKVDIIEDVLADIAQSIGELAVQNYDELDVQGLIGKRLAADWRQMPVEELNAEYSIEIVAGSTEKPTSAFKKKEAIQVAQAIGQFAQAAPGAALRIMLKVMSQAFSEVVVKPGDWDAIAEEIQANLTKGVSTPGAQQQPGGEQAPMENGLPPEIANLPDEVKQRIVEMQQSGIPPEQIQQFLMQAVQENRQQ